MFSPTGYVSLATLWREFFDKHRVQLDHQARRVYGKRDRLAIDGFGSPVDYCEDAFLSGFRDICITAARPIGETSELDTSLGNSASTLFLKATVFESCLIAKEPLEAGEKREWFTRMGSAKFKAWPHADYDLEAWQRDYPAKDPATISIADTKGLPYHTLSYVFERDRFIVPECPPPWSIDLIDEHYAGRLLSSFAGCVFCVPDQTAENFRSDNRTFANATRRFELEADIALRAGGRPRKQEPAARAYRELFPNGHDGTLQAACNEIAERTGLQVDVRTLRRGLKKIDRRDDTKK